MCYNLHAHVPGTHGGSDDRADARPFFLTRPPCRLRELDIAAIRRQLMSFATNRKFGIASRATSASHKLSSRSVESGEGGKGDNETPRKV